MAIAGENDLFTLVRCKDEAGWLEQRTQGVGGSDVAAIMGLSPWKTATQLWLEKTRRVEPEDISDKPHVRFGNQMEPLIRDWYHGEHPDRTVRRVNAICKSIERPWAQASLDYEVRDGGEWGILEMKTARSAKDWADGVPDHYLTQVTHYMSVTGRRFADVAVFFRDSCEYRAYRVERDEEDVSAVVSAVDSFWHDFVEADVMPAVTGTASEASSLASYWRGGGEGFASCSNPAADDLADAYADAAERERAAKRDKAEAATKLIALIGEAKGIETDVYRVTWSRGERDSFDSKRFRAEHPDLYASYVSRVPRNGGIRVKELS